MYFALSVARTTAGKAVDCACIAPLNGQFQATQLRADGMRLNEVDTV
jgi:hypothetical protein